MIRSETAEEHYFRTHDGCKLFYRRWPGTGNRALVLLHRGHEHSGRIAHLVDELSLPDVSFFAWDARAHGRSEGKQDSTVTMSTFVQDLDEFVRHIRGEFDFSENDIAVIAQSMGAVMAAAWVHDYAPAIRSMVLAAPAFCVKLYVPFARIGLAVWEKVVGNFYIKSYVKGRALTHDAERAASYHSDPLVKLRISVRVLLDLFKTSERLIADAGAIRVPTQVLLSGSDWVIHNKPVHRFFEQLDTEDKEIHTFEGFFHDTLGERDRHLAIAKARTFLQEQFETPFERPLLLDADFEGFTKREYDRLLRPLSFWSPKGAALSLSKSFLRTAGRISDGIRLGVEAGFDSGSSLDYVYRNNPSGRTPIGRLLDWFYLNSHGWRGIRVRKQMIEELIGQTMMHMREHRRPIHIVDVAAGHGRYVLDAIEDSGIIPDHTMLWDFDPANVRRGRNLIEAKRLPVEFKAGDAFDRRSLAAIQPKPTLAIVSGLFELFSENALVRGTLEGLAAAMERGGYLIYTGQPWHPQLEFIGRTLTSHRGGMPWIMRRRTQDELDQLVRAAGFRKLEQRIDPSGLFTVSVAERC